MKRLAVVLAVLFCLSLASGASANLLINGGFETGAWSPWVKSGEGAIETSGNWSIPAYEGDKFAGKVSSWMSIDGNIYQTVDRSGDPVWGNPLGSRLTVSGATILRMIHYGNWWENVYLDVVLKYYDDAFNEFTIPLGTISNVDTGNYQQEWLPFEYSVNFVAYDPQWVTLDITWRNTDNPEWSFGYVDGLELTSEVVPEPGSMMALGAGLMGLAGFVIRRRK